MNIESLFKQFTENAAQIYLYQRAIKSSTDNELKKLEEYEKSHGSIPDFENFSKSLDAMYFLVASNGENLKFSVRKRSIEEMKRDITLHKNKQYKWLFVDIYEAFEDFVENAYAYAAFIDHNFWPLSDFGNISLEELKSIDHETLLKKAKNKRNAPRSILQQFRNKVPMISKMESENALEVNLKLAVTLCENLRHIIVHNGGIVSSRENFAKKVLEDCGLYNNGKYKKSHLKLINAFFGEGDYINTISFLERHYIGKNK